MSRTTKTISKSRFVVEIPAELEAKLKKEAVLQNRSRNAQITQVLKERYSHSKKEIAVAG